MDERTPEFLDLLRAAYPEQIACTVPQAARATGVSDSAFRRLLKAGVMPTVFRPTSGTIRQRPLIDLRPVESP